MRLKSQAATKTHSRKGSTRTSSTVAAPGRLEVERASAVCECRTEDMESSAGELEPTVHRFRADGWRYSRGGIKGRGGTACRRGPRRRDGMPLRNEGETDEPSGGGRVN